MRLAIVGSGIAGMTAAHLLEEHHEIHLFEADDRPGGHAHTVTVDLPEGQVGADTGFLVYNERTYPLFTRLLARLGVAHAPERHELQPFRRPPRTGVAWHVALHRLRPTPERGTASLSGHAGRRRPVQPVGPPAPGGSRVVPSGSLADFLAAHRWSRGFLDWYLIPLGSAIWSADPETFTQIPARTFAEFFSRHGLLGPGHQPAWRTVTGGSTRYVQAILEPLTRRGGLHLRTAVAKVRRLPDGVELLTPNGPATFDHVIMATHSDQALALLADPTDEERRVLGAIRYQQNRATLHTDTRLLPANRRAWASWNYVRADEPRRQSTLTYYLNRLQGFDADQPVMVTLNRDGAIDPEQIVARMDYAHPIIDEAAVAVQSRQESLSAGSVSFCGAYWGYGFHEDGVRSALAISRRFGARL